MKTFWEIREGRDDRSQAAKDRDAGKTTPQSTKKAALAKAKKLSSTMDVGDLYQSSEMDKRIGVMYGSPGYLPPDMESRGLDKFVPQLRAFFDAFLQTDLDG